VAATTDGRRSPKGSVKDSIGQDDEENRNDRPLQQSGYCAGAAPGSGGRLQLSQLKESLMAIRREHGPEGTRHGRPAIRLNVVITSVALILAAVAAQSPFF